MKKKSISKLHFCNVKESLEFASPVDKVCTALLSAGIKTFLHIRFHTQTETLKLLSNKKNLLIALYENPGKLNIMIPELMRFTLAHKVSSETFTVRHLWTFDAQDSLTNRMNECGFSNVFTMSHYSGNIFEAVCFGTNIENKDIINFYLNNQPLLNSFANYFVSSFQEQIENDTCNLLNEDQFILSEDIENKGYSIKSLLTRILAKILESLRFLKKLSPRNSFFILTEDNYESEVYAEEYPLSFIKKNGKGMHQEIIIFSGREFHILNIMGKLNVKPTIKSLAKEISKNINITPSSAQTHILNMIKKCSVTTPKELIDLYSKERPVLKPSQQE